MHPCSFTDTFFMSIFFNLIFKTLNEDINFGETTVDSVNPLSAQPHKMSNTLTNCWTVFDHFAGLAFKG